ncbi:di-trans,poly-cis-decaprenylcistransferase [Candidatus Microgenomates bacterium]|nr:MAG: di-trans,poly-cis-decaprenylcistransferase [Candidatus Microgenomates bacterium]
MNVIPTHIAIIMDGNRRWAREHGKHVLAGHQYVADVLLEQLIEHASDRGIKYVTMWAWSTENWQRAPSEVKGVMHLMRYLLGKGLAKFHKNGVRLKVIGDIDAFPKDIASDIRAGVEKTRDNQKITVVLALNYGGRDEITRAINKLVIRHPEASAEGSRLKAAQNNASLDFSPPKADRNDGEITKETFSKYLDTAGIPDPELIIRTGGEKRLSGFLLWQSEYAELYFTDTLMPDFSPEELDRAIEDFSQRKRRFGK